MKLPEPPSPPSNQYTYGPAHAHATRLLWIGVVSFTVLIIILWGWSVKQKMLWFNWTKTPENQLATAAKTDWDKAFAEQKQKQDDQAVVKQKLETVVKAMINKK